MRHILLAFFLLLFAGAAQAQGFDDSPPGITQLSGACNTASLGNMPTATPSAGGVGLACANHLYNWDAARLPHFRNAMQALVQGGGDVSVLMLGDSTIMGVGAGSGTQNLVGAHLLNTPSQLVSLMKLAGMPVSNESLAFSNAVQLAGGGFTYNQYDPRYSDDTTWSQFSSTTIAGELYSSSSGTGTFSFAPTGAFDSFDIYYVRNPSNAAFTVSVDGVLKLTVSNGSQAFLKSTVSVARGVHTITVTCTNASGGGVFIGPIVPHDSANPAIQIINGGVGSATMSTFTNASGQPWRTINSGALTTFAPKLVFIEMTINDSNNNATPVSTYTANMQAAITAYQTAGADVVLVSGSPYSSVSSTVGPYIAALYSLALSNSIPMLDLNARYISYTYTNTNTSFYYNTLHFNQAGYGDKAQAYFNAIQDMFGSITNNSVPASVPPTIASGFGTSPTAPVTSWQSFQVVVGSGGTAATGVLTLPAAAHGWNCSANDITTMSTAVSVTKQTAGTTTSVTLGNFTDVSVSGPWAAGDTLNVKCLPY